VGACARRGARRRPGRARRRRRAGHRGLQPDGKYDVRVNVSGQGFGKPDANSKNWKVVVSFDCP
jgi:hypothetical protein